MTDQFELTEKFQNMVHELISMILILNSRIDAVQNQVDAIERYLEHHDPDFPMFDFLQL